MEGKEGVEKKKKIMIVGKEKLQWGFSHDSDLKVLVQLLSQKKIHIYSFG